MPDILTATEEKLRDMQVPWFKSPEELTSYIDALVTRPHDYGTCVYAMSMAATAAFIYVAGQLGVSGFQAGCADMDFLRRSRDLKGPFAIINAENMLYPQYDIIEKVKGWLADWQEWAGKEAAKRMAKNDQAMIHPDVWARWAELKRREILFRNFSDVLNPEA